MGRSKPQGGLGFQDFECFNLAMLAKQGWRLLHSSDSLVARVLKEKYYPQSTFLAASIGSRPLYAWQSICNSRPLLTEGLFWRVGNGESINIWTDKWIPHLVTFQIQSLVHMLASDAKVSALIDPHSRWWNIDLIHRLFSLEEASSIYNLALSPAGQLDKLIWNGTSSGTFSVRSTYYLEKDRRNRNQGECSLASSTSMVWRQIWQLKLPGVVRTFLWRVCHNSLPTKVNFFHKQVVPDPNCPMCGLTPETTGHILWECPTSKAAWMDCRCRIQKLSILEDDELRLIEQLLSKLDVEDFLFMACLARNLWLNQNTCVFGGKPLLPGTLIQQTTGFLEAFMTKPKNLLSSGRLPYLLTASGIIKINWDAALATSSKQMGVGIIARDNMANVVAAHCTTLPFITDPSLAEAIAAWKAIEFCELQEFHRIILEGDALVIVQALRSTGPTWLRYGQVIEDCRAKLSTFQTYTFSHTRREANEAAHRLAKFALTQSLDQTWEGFCPLFLHSLVLAEQEVSV